MSKQLTGVCYTGVRKVTWDCLWHAMYEVKRRGGVKVGETWDRVDRAEALRIATKIEKGQAVPRGSCERKARY